MLSSSQFKQLLLSQYVTSGLQVSVGVGAVSIGLGISYGVAFAVSAASGAVCVSICDLPGAVKLKTLQLSAAVVLTTLISYLVSYARLNVFAELVAVIGVSIFGGMINVFGKKAIALSFVCLYALIIGIGTPAVDGAEFQHAARFGLGALLYALYALVMACVLRFRTKQQALAEAVFELARYLDAKAAFFEKDADVNQCYGALVAKQVDLVEKQQAARDIVFSHVRGARHVRLSSILIGTLDVTERVFSSHTDYGLIHATYGASDVVMFLRDLAHKAALDLRRIGYAILRGREAPHAVIYRAEVIAIEYELARLKAQPMSAAERSALEALDGVYLRLHDAIGLIGELHTLVHNPPVLAHLPEGLVLKKFVSNFSFSPRLVQNELHLRSPVLRFSIRLTLAMTTGFGLAHVLPYATHSYWILLTVAVILRANYSVTRQRRNDRILGTLLGCLFIATLLHFKPGYALEVLVMLVALGVAHVFATLIYRYTAMAACVMAVLQVHFLNPGAPFAISERLIDTLVGAALAFAFSYVLPSWEHLSIARLVRELLKALARYTAAILELETPDPQYRLARKQLFDTIALTSATFRRMLSEPRGQRRAVAELNDFITSSYTFASNMAALRLLIRDPANPRPPEVARCCAAAAQDVLRIFSDPAPLLERAASEAAALAPPSEVLLAEEALPQGLLARRLALVRVEAQRLVGLADAIGPALGDPAGTLRADPKARLEMAS